MSWLLGTVAVVIRTESSVFFRTSRTYPRRRTPRGRPGVTSLTPMSNRTYRVTEIVGTSKESVDTAIRNGIERAATSLRHIDWFEVTQIRGHVQDGTVEHFQVGLKVGFRLEDDGDID